MTDNKYTGCKGCLNDVVHMACSRDMYDSSLCPCQICLIKGICRDICEEYNQFRKEDDKQVLERLNQG